MTTTTPEPIPDTDIKSLPIQPKLPITKPKEK